MELLPSGLFDRFYYSQTGFLETSVDHQASTQGAGSWLPLKFYATHAWTLLCIPWKEVWDDFPVHFYLTEKSEQFELCAAQLCSKLGDRKVLHPRLLLRRDWKWTFSRALVLGVEGVTLEQLPKTTNAKKEKKLCYIFSTSSLHRSQTAPQKNNTKCCISSPHHSLHLTDNSPQKNKQKKKWALSVLNAEIWTKICEIGIYQRGQFQKLLTLKGFRSTKMAKIKRNICLHKNLKLEVQKPVVATKEGLIEVNQSTGKKSIRSLAQTFILPSQDKNGFPQLKKKQRPENQSTWRLDLSHKIPNSKRPLFWVLSLIHPCTEIRVSWDLVAV